MDDLGKKRLEKAIKLIEKIGNNFSNKLKIENLNKLKQRREEIINLHSEASGINRANRNLQIRELDKSIALLENQLQGVSDADTDIDEEAARKFLRDNPDLISQQDVNFIEQNDALDKLEADLYDKEKK